MAGVPANPLGQVAAGGRASLVNSGVQQLICNGGDVAKIKPGPALLDLLQGAATAGFGSYASDPERLGDSWSNTITGAFTVGTSAECGLLGAFKLLAC